MTATHRHAVKACLSTGALFIAIFPYAHAAVPEVSMEADPLTSLRCLTPSVDSLIASGSTTSTAKISSTGASLYQTAFNKATWGGSLKKYSLGFDDAGAISVPANAEWDAADILSGTISIAAKPAPEARHIYTSVALNQTMLTMPFLWQSLSSAQRTMLHTSPITGCDDQLGEKRLDYLRGGRQYELGSGSGAFRKRDRVLGAIVHSTPVFVGAPSTGLQANDYQVFYTEHKERRAAVYVGASDGMLHGFAADSGEELFAYIPQAVFKKLSTVTQPDGIYRPLVDGPITVAEARIGNQWKTILASGMGGGGQGVFALDVTKPDQFEKGLGALWEFTDADDADMGNVIGAPVIAKFKTRIVKGVATYRDFVVVAGGLNSYRDDGVGRFNPQAQAVLFLLALDKGKSEPWKIGSNFFKFTIPVVDKTLPNGLTAPALIIADDGAVSYIYTGDLQGNVWRFDFNGNAPWAAALGGGAIKPLFIALDGQGSRQPITQKIQLVYAPYGGYLLLFGTGKFMDATDIDSTRFKTQSFYGVLDTLDSKAVTRSQLIERKLMFATSGTSVLEMSGSEVRFNASTNGDKGWYFDFLTSDKTGERSISSAIVKEDSLFFNTLIPNLDPCQNHGGRSYVLKTLTGLPTYANLTAQLANVGVMSTPMVIEIMPEQIARDVTGKRREKKKLEVIDPMAIGKPGQKVSAPKNVVETTTLSGRLSWREIVNWVELRTSAIKK